MLRFKPSRGSSGCSTRGASERSSKGARLAGGRATPVDHAGRPLGSRVPLRTPIGENPADVRGEPRAEPRVRPPHAAFLRGLPRFRGFSARRGTEPRQIGPIPEPNEPAHQVRWASWLTEGPRRPLGPSRFWASVRGHLRACRPGHRSPRPPPEITSAARGGVLAAESALSGPRRGEVRLWAPPDSSIPRCTSDDRATVTSRGWASVIDRSRAWVTERSTAAVTSASFWTSEAWSKAVPKRCSRACTTSAGSRLAMRRVKMVCS